jgi:molecular chaperone GrpE
MNEELNKNINEELNETENIKEETSAPAEKKAEEKSGPEKQVEMLQEKVVSLEAEISELKDRRLRLAAEFENYKRRTENEQINLLKYAAEPFILKVLSIYDDLERSLSHANGKGNLESLTEGLKMVFDKFTKTLDEQGLKKIESKGQPFDVNFHEALLQQQAEGVDPNTVIEEVEAGYLYKDKVIRHSKVIVSALGE